MTGELFVTQLLEDNEKLLARIDATQSTAAPAASQDLATLLKLALKNEAEAVEIAAAWVPLTAELEAKMALARHAGDEARHYQLLEEQVRAAGVGLDGFEPLAPPSPVLEFLRGLATTEERVAAALVAREAMGGRRNAQFLRLLEQAGREEIARLYREVINPDEERHHRAGCALLARLADSPEKQERARRASLALLETGNRVREALLAKTGAACVPGC